MNFTKKKFLSLDVKSQHKKLSEIIRKLYEQYDPELFSTLQKLQSWIHEPITSNPDKESFSKSFHYHLSLADFSISEHQLLTKTLDRKKPLKPWLDVDIYLDHIRSAHNIGNILRTCEAFRLGRVLFSSEMAKPNHPQIIKTSMGAFEEVETQVISSHEEFEKRPLIAIETHEKSTSLEKFTFPKSFTLIMGNEEFGVSESLLKKADHIVEIPLYGKKNSLNVAACFSILAYRIQLDLR